MPFYKYENNEFLLDAEDVEGTGFSLHDSTKDHYQYPVEGWFWFPGISEAREFFNIPLPLDENIDVYEN